MAQIEAKVAEILSESQLAFNVGSDQGVTEGCPAVVKKSVSIIDPDTNEELGRVLVSILRLRIGLVDSRFCVGIVTEKQETEDNLMVNALIRPGVRLKKIVKTPTEEKPGLNVFIRTGSMAAIETSEAE